MMLKIKTFKCINNLATAMLCGLALALSAQAASFDCAKASSNVEQIICGDAELSKLDDELANSYRQELEQSENKALVAKEQRQWMKDRNHCSDSVCVRNAYEKRLALIKTARDEPYTLVMSKNKELCEYMLGLYNTDMVTNGHIDYDSHDIFSQIKWQEIEHINEPLVTHMLRAVFDINNDGKDELVIKQTWTREYLLEESLYIFPLNSDVLSKLTPGKGGMKVLIDDPNALFKSNTFYYLKDLPDSLREKDLDYKLKHLPKYLKNVNIEDLRRDLRNAYISNSFVLQPFTWNGTTYISMTDRNTEWIAVVKYEQANEVQDICYYYNHTHKFINY